MKRNKVYACWSPFHGVGTTANCISSALDISLNYAIKSLVMHNQYIKSNMETAFLASESSDLLANFEDKGVDALERLAMSAQLTSENFYNYTTTIIEERLSLVTGTTKPKEELFEKMRHTIMNIVKVARDSYDLVFVDANAGNRNEMTVKVLEEADVVVVCLSQNKLILDTFFQKREWLECLDNKPLILVIGKYDPTSKYTTKFIKNAYEYSGEIFTIPYCSSFLDSHNDHRVADYFLANIKRSRKDDSSYYFQEVKKLSKAILDLSSIDTKYKEKQLEQLNTITKILRVFS
jgi:MinD-like ATPase involved in chromosome partitioning or flagellar assembly